jgi:hypothetical protein
MTCTSSVYMSSKSVLEAGHNITASYNNKAFYNNTASYNLKSSYNRKSTRAVAVGLRLRIKNLKSLCLHAKG